MENNRERNKTGNTTEEKTQRQETGEEQSEQGNNDEDTPYRILLTAPKEPTPQSLNKPKREMPDRNRLQIPKPVRKKKH